MKFKQTMALGLSTLMIAGNGMMPCALATSMVLNNGVDSQNQLIDLRNNPQAAALVRKQLAGVQKKRNLFSLLNPFAFLIRKDARIQTAMTVPVAQAIAMPLQPEAVINPAIAAPLPEDQPTAKSENPAPAKETYTQIFPAAKKETQPVPAQKATLGALPRFENIFPTGPVRKAPRQAATAARKTASVIPPLHEALNMLAVSPLEKLAGAAKPFYAGGLDSASPDISIRGQGDVTVLKSGISQKVTHVELTIGKAEVIYLSRPASRVSVSNPDVASAVVISPTQIQLVGKAVGVANLLVWGDMYSSDHTVVDISVHRDVSTLANQLKYIDPGINIVPMAAEDTVILNGEVESREKAQMAIEMAKAYFTKNTAGAAAGTGPNSQAPGSAIPGQATNVINLLKVKGEPSTKLELVRQRLNEIDPNVRIDVVPGPEGNEKVILTGRVASASIASRALNMASAFYGQPGLKIVTGQGGNEFARMNMSAGTGGTGGSGGGGGAATTGANMLQGSVMTDATGNVISMMEIAQKPQIKCSIKFLELSKNAVDALGGTLQGVKGNKLFAHMSGAQSALPGRGVAGLASQPVSGSVFQSVSGGGILTNGGGSSGSNDTVSAGNSWGNIFGQAYQNGVTQILSLNNNYAMAIQALQEKRQIRTLAEPTLTMLSGEQGSFLAGGEIPIAAVGGQGQISIEYKEFGVRLNLLPNVTDDGKIQMQVSPEVSEIDQTNGVNTSVASMPAFVTRRMNTTLIVEPGQSFVLAGMFKQMDTNSVSRFPGIGALPVIGTFFRNKWKDRRNTEMVVIIRPEIMYSQTGPTRHAAEPSQTDGRLSSN